MKNIDPREDLFFVANSNEYRDLLIIAIADMVHLSLRSTEVLSVIFYGKDNEIGWRIDYRYNRCSYMSLTNRFPMLSIYLDKLNKYFDSIETEDENMRPTIDWCNDYSWAESCGRDSVNRIRGLDLDQEEDKLALATTRKVIGFYSYPDREHEEFYR